MAIAVLHQASDQGLQQVLKFELTCALNCSSLSRKMFARQKAPAADISAAFSVIDPLSELSATC